MKRGNVAICLHDEDGNAVRCTLENTLFIPSYPQCIFSVQAATRNGARVNFDGSTAELITRWDKVPSYTASKIILSL